MDSIIINDIQNINIIEDNSYIYSNIEPLFENIFDNLDEKENLKSNSLLRKKNAEFSRQTRQRKKLEFERIQKENQFLKQKIQFLEKYINQNLCKECKSKIIPYIKPSIDSNTSNNKYRKNIFFFTTSITIIILYLLLNNSNDNINHLRKLRNQYERDILLSSDYILNSTISSHAMYIRYGDYYSIIHQKPFLGNEKFSIKNEIRNINEYDLKEEIEPENCTNCVIHLNDNCLKVIGPFKFSLYLTPGYISTPFYNKSYDNYTINGNKYFTYYEFEMTGYSINKAIIQAK